MAVAGLHNLSAFGPSFFGDSQPPVSGRWGDEPSGPSTRASSLLQMWRELEGDHVVSPSHRSGRQRNGLNSEGLSTSMSVGQGSDSGRDIPENADEMENQSVMGTDMEHEDNNSVISEQSSDLGEMERERVRQIFREWMKSGATGHSSDEFHLNNRSGPQWLGENECERVRIIREWVQMNVQQRNNQGSLGDGGGADSQIEQVRDGLVISNAEIGGRRPIRRLCGRQTLLDLLERARCERKGELQGLLQQRPVSDFAHRNRIQALLRGRFLRNERLIPDKRPSSVAAVELGLLRQRHTVSGLREGFLSKLDNSTATSVNGAEADSSFGDENNGELESTCREWELLRNHTALGFDSAADGNRSQQEFVIQVTEAEDPVLLNGRNVQEMSSDNERNEQEVSLDIEESQQEVPLLVGSSHSRNERVLDTETTEPEASSDSEHAGSRDVQERNSTITNELPLEAQDINFSRSLEVFREHFESRSVASYVHEEAGPTTDLEGSTNAQFNSRDASAQVDEAQESVTETEDSAWQQLSSGASTEWMDDSREAMTRSWPQSSANQWVPEISDNNAVEQDQMDESHEDWPIHDLQEAIDSWLDMPSGEVGASSRRIHTFYFPDDDDNAQSMELRELFSRRRVSSLLRSSFRESLDQVLQSHVERQGIASGDWEMDNESSSPSLVEQDQGQQNGDRALALSDAAYRNPFAPTSTLVTAPQPLWDEELQGASLSHNSNQLFGTEWEVINELRIDMARLQRRLNNMQSMLEHCMDVQIELQRSVRQEVSAALNRSILTRDASKGDMIEDESQWDYVRRGICCLCCDSKIDSLLYRCGHMCTCSKCAEKLVQGMEKCPMCQAPVVEAVRAYFIQ